MANLVKHRFASGKTDGPDATQVQPSHWNDGHAFSGGNAGDVLTRDPTDASFGAKWATPAAAPVSANWTPIDTSGAGLTLTVTSARYWRYDKLVVVTLHFAFPTNSSSLPAFIGGSPWRTGQRGRAVSDADATHQVRVQCQRRRPDFMS